MMIPLTGSDFIIYLENVWVIKMIFCVNLKVHGTVFPQVGMKDRITK
jgi:hypothetical protein